MTTQLTSSLGALLLAGAAVVHASPVVTALPGGSISGAPGATIGWGFTATPDPQYAASFIASFLTGETNPSLGTYSDIISYQGGPSQGLLNPGAPWTENFSFSADPAQQMGLGAYQISSSAAPGQSDSGNILLEYELFTVSGPCPGCYVESGTLQVPFTVTVADGPSAPEPATWSMLLGAALAAMGCRWRRRG